MIMITTLNSRLIRALFCSLSVFVLLLVAGCTFKAGDRKLNSRYVYAQSTVTPLRNVSASTRKTGLTCSFTREEYEALYDRALSQDPSANVMLDYATTYEMTAFPFICTNKLTISGLAAAAEVR